MKYRRGLKNASQSAQTNTRIHHFNQQPCWIQDGFCEAETDVLVLGEHD